MLKHLRLLNPFVRISTVAEARTAARAGAVGAYLGAVQAGAGAVLLALTSSSVADAMRKGMIATMPTDVEADSVVMAMKMVPGLVVAMTVMSAAVAIACAVLGAIQWRKLTRLIPLLLLLFTIFGLASALNTRVTTPPEAIPDTGIPIWYGALNWALSIAEVLLLIVGFRGGNVLVTLDGARATMNAPSAS